MNLSPTQIEKVTEFIENGGVTVEEMGNKSMEEVLPYVLAKYTLHMINYKLNDGVVVDTSKGFKYNAMQYLNEYMKNVQDISVKTELNKLIKLLNVNGDDIITFIEEADKNHKIYLFNLKECFQDDYYTFQRIVFTHYIESFK